MNCLINPEIIFYNIPPENPIVVITGLARSGTTAVAQVIGSFIPLIFDSHGNLECKKFSKYVKSNDIDSLFYMAESNSKSWAIKMPLVFRKRDILQQAFGIRLVWIIVVRDFIGKAIRETMSMGGTLEKNLEVTWKEENELYQWLTNETLPRALLSYNTICHKQGTVRNQLLQWFSITDKEDIL